MPETLCKVRKVDACLLPRSRKRQASGVVAEVNCNDEDSSRLESRKRNSSKDVSDSSKKSQQNFGKYIDFQGEVAAIPMSILRWNCQGARSTEIVRYLQDLRRKYFPGFFISYGD